MQSTGQRAAVHLDKNESSVGGGSEETEDKSESDKEDEKEHREPIEHLLKVKQLTVILFFLYIVTISDQPASRFCTRLVYNRGLLYG